MLIRFIAKNIFSFREETEFNLLPGRTKHLPHHIKNVGGIDVLRMSAIYGANGSGKSNFINAISLLNTIVEKGSFQDIKASRFLLTKSTKDQPSTLAIEFVASDKCYYYVISFSKSKVKYESLEVTENKHNSVIFERSYDDKKQHIVFDKEFSSNDNNKVFIEVLQDKIIKDDEILLHSLATKFKDEVPLSVEPFNWIKHNLIIIPTNARYFGGVAHLLEDKEMNLFANDYICRLDTGIKSMAVKTRTYSDKEFSFEDLKDTINDMEGIHFAHPKDPTASLIFEGNSLIEKKLETLHVDEDGDSVTFPMTFESDGTHRLIDFIPAINDLITEDCVYIIDEIERSIHPLLIKQIISSLSQNNGMKGQLIFSTHESSLLSNEILRKDEIWFAQKDPMDGSTKMYSLNDFKTHHSVSVENGYLSGRYGGIPFLGNLKELNWDHE